MNELLNSTVLTRGSGTFGTFVVQDGTVKKGHQIILTFFNNLALVPANARTSFTIPQEHQLFDGLLFALMGESIGVEYIADVRSFLNPELRMKEFLTLDAAGATAFNEKFGLKLSAEELRLADIQKSVTEKFGAVFTAPKTPVPPIAIDVDEVFGRNAEEVAKWLRNEITETSMVVRDLANRGDKGANNLLRVVRNNNNRDNGVQCLTGHRVSLTVFKSAAKRAIDAWNGSTTPIFGRDYIISFNISARPRSYRYTESVTVRVRPDHVAVGCQSVSRSEIERIYAELTAA